MGKMWIFGGYGDYNRQLLSVRKCGVKSEGTLPFDLAEGAANTVDGLESNLLNGGQSALLCFNYWTPKACFS